jgi:hypothetical protein
MMKTWEKTALQKAGHAHTTTIMPGKAIISSEHYGWRCGDMGVRCSHVSRIYPRFYEDWRKTTING